LPGYSHRRRGRRRERLAELLIELREAGLLRWRAEYSAAMLALFFYDAARGVNQTLPPRPAVSLPERYREIFTPLLRGVSENSGSGAEVFAELFSKSDRFPAAARILRHG